MGARGGVLPRSASRAKHRRMAFRSKRKRSRQPCPAGRSFFIRRCQNSYRAGQVPAQRSHFAPRMGGMVQKSFVGAIALFAFVLSSAAWGHGPSRQKITEPVEINAAPAKVWAAIADFHDISWLPGVAKTTGEGGNVPDTAKRASRTFAEAARNSLAVRFLAHLHSSMVTMSQKSSVLQTAKAVSQALTPDMIEICFADNKRTAAFSRATTIASLSGR